MKILNIPFISRPKAKILTKGIAKYIINDKGFIVDEYVELLDGSQFLGKSKYGGSFDKKIIDFRVKFMNNPKNTEILSSEKLGIINEYFLNNLTTVLNHDKYTTGSNPSGSDYNIRRTPYIIYGGMYNQFLFINFFKELRVKSTENLRTQNLSNIELNGYLELFPEIRSGFMKFNEVLFKALNSDDEGETVEIDNSDDFKGVIDFILSDNYKLELKDSDEKNNQRVLKLRRIFKNRLNQVKPSDHLFGKLPADMCELAHIFPVSEIRKLPLEKWYMIADENNGLSLPIQIHKLYDSYKIYFDENGNMNFLNSLYKDYLSEIFKDELINSKIPEILITEKRKKYIKIYNDIFIGN